MSVSQHWEKEKYEKNARFVSDYGEELIEWLSPKNYCFHFKIPSFCK